MNTYGYKRLTLKKLKEDLTPDTAAAIVIEGTPKEGATSTFDLTGLTKEASKVWGSNIAYFITKKGVGNVAANFGLLDIPFEKEGEVLGYASPSAGIQGIGESTDPGYYAAVSEAEDLYGEPVAFALVAGKFSKDGFSLATATDAEFTPEPGEYVFTATSRDIEIATKTENYTVLRALGTAAVEELKTAVLGAP